MGNIFARVGFFCRLPAEFSHRKRYFRFLWENLPGKPCLLAGLPEFFPTEILFWSFLWEIFLPGQSFSSGWPRIFPIGNALLSFYGKIFRAMHVFWQASLIFSHRNIILEFSMGNILPGQAFSAGCQRSFPIEKGIFRFLWENLPDNACLLARCSNISPIEKGIFGFYGKIYCQDRPFV